jgi:hypothetical protein
VTPWYKRAVVADLGGFADDDASAVIDEEAATNGGAGMDVDVGQPAPDEGQPARAESPAPAPEAMREAMHEDGVQAGIGQQHFDARSRRRVAIENAGQVFREQRPQPRRGLAWSGGVEQRRREVGHHRVSDRAV